MRTHLQDSYRKVDLISKAEFDSQRGAEELDQEADSDLVFGPLDQEELSAGPPPPSGTQPLAGHAPKPEQRLTEQEQQRGREKDREEKRVKSASTGSPSPHTRQRRKKDRFYPVLNKQQQSSPNSNVSGGE